MGLLGIKITFFPHPPLIPVDISYNALRAHPTPPIQSKREYQPIRVSSPFPPQAMVRSEKPGLSGGHKISYGRPSFQNRSNKISINRTGAEIKLARERQKEHIAALSFTQREELLGHGAHDIEMLDAPDYYSADWHDFDSDDKEALLTLPPGEEGYLHSHAGKEATFHEIFDRCCPGRDGLGAPESVTTIASPVMVFLQISKASPRDSGTLACTQGWGHVTLGRTSVTCGGGQKWMPSRSE
ncbi:hypothetical protein B0H14DRAFT_2630665 [Mycena olivaceomarginata]|nr:hypothetical protein B0H14DRAFT_2630665 [Mycena olivaceomarginata]